MDSHRPAVIVPRLRGPSLVLVSFCNFSLLELTEIASSHGSIGTQFVSTLAYR